jgi:hypothetical protein
MLIVSPTEVVFATRALGGVTRVVIERRAAKVALEWSDLGRYVAFADVPEQEVRVRLEQAASAGELDGPQPGDQGQLALVAAGNAGAIARTRITLTGVVVGVRYDLPVAGPGTRVIELVAVSATGASDPVALSAAE